MMFDDMHIGLVGPLPPPSGGMANQTRQLAGLLQSEGATVEVLQVNAPYRPAWIGAIRGLRGLFRLLPYLVGLWQLAGRAGLLHVMANSGWSWHLYAAPAVWIARLRGVPIVINYRGGGADRFLDRSLRWVRPTLLRANAVVVPSGFLREVFARRGFASLVVPNIIDLDRFSAPGASSSRAAGSSPHLIVTRNLEQVYDIGTALRAFHLVRQRIPAARMSIAGTGPELATLQALATKLGIQESVKFCGRIDNEQMAALYRSADLMLNSSRVDNMPISILEALACGVPVVSTDVGGVPFVVDHGKTAMLVPARDATAMANAALAILTDDRLGARLADTGRLHVQQFAWTRVRAGWFDVYHRLLGDVLQSVRCTRASK